MFPEILNDICRLSHLTILGEIKRAGGLGITEIAQIMDMSYMGVKAHCVKLEKQGYIEGMREPRGSNMGRPRKVFSLTEKCDPLFPTGGDELVLDLLDSVKTSFGESAPEKLLFHYFEKKRDSWAAAVKPGKNLLEKATKFAAERRKSGHFCQCHYSKEEGFIMEDYHHPLHTILENYPSLIAIENKHIEKVLGTKLTREEKKGMHGSVICTVYRIDVGA